MDRLANQKSYTDCMEHSLVFEANECSAGQENPCFYVMFIAVLTKFNTEVYYTQIYQLVAQCFYIDYTRCVHVPAIYPSHLQGVTSFGKHVQYMANCRR
jgi:hypothetical protein